MSFVSHAQTVQIFYQDFESGCGANNVPSCMVQTGSRGFPASGDATQFYVGTTCAIAGTRSLTTARAYQNGSCGSSTNIGGNNFCPCTYGQGDPDSIFVYFSNPISLENYINTRFEFMYAGGAEGNDFDYGGGAYSTDLSTWVNVGPTIDNTPGNADIDFSALGLDGATTVYIGFYFNSDGLVAGDPYTAIQIDNVKITGECILTTPTVTSSTGQFDFCDGETITLTSSSAADYQWYKDGVALGGETNQTLEVSTAGDYYVIIPSQECNFQSITHSVEVNSTPPKPDLKPDVSPIETCGSGSGVELSFTNDPSYQLIRWYNDGTLVASSGTTYNANESGFYYVQVISADNCDNYSDTVEIGLYPNPAQPVISSEDPQSICSGESVTLNSSYGTGNQWFRNGVEISGANGDFLIVTQGGSYTVRHTDANGCTSTSAPYNVTVNSKPGKPTITGANQVCQNDSIVLTSSSASSYQWYKGASPLSGQTNQTLVVKTAGDYKVRVFNAAGCFTDSDPHTVSVLSAPKPTVNPNGNVALCEGETTTLTSSAADGYQWFNQDGPIGGATGQSYEVTTTGVYGVQVTLANGCTPISDSVYVDIASNPAKPQVFVDGTNEVCEGDSVRIITNLANAYQWYKDGVAIPDATNQDYYVVEAGDYHVVVFNESGCSNTSNPKTINIKPAPEDPVVKANGDTTFCYPGAVELEITSAGDNYQWHKDGVAISGAVGTTYIADESGEYSVLVTNNNSCSKYSRSITVTIYMEVKPDISINGTTDLCSGDSRVLTSNYETGNQWFDGTQPLVGQTGKTLTITEGGDYYTRVTNNSCTRYSDTITVIERANPDQPTITPGDTALCAGETVTLFAQTSETKYAWYKDGALIFGSGKDSLVVSESGSYQVSVANDFNCESISEPVEVTIYFEDPLTITPSEDQVICDNEPITLMSNSPVGNQWFLNGDTIPGATEQSYTTNIPGYYHVAGGVGACEDVSDSVLVDVLSSPNQPVITAGGPTTFCYGDSVRLFTDDEGFNYVWLRNGQNTGVTDTTYLAQAEGDYQVVATNNEGCSDTSDVVAVEHLDRPIITQVIVDNNSCDGFETGRLEVITTGGTGALLFALDGVRNYQLENVFEDLAPDTYDVIVRDANGCSDTVPATVGNDVNDLAVAVNIDQQVTCNGGSNGAFTATGDGGEGDLEYSIDGTNFGLSGIFTNLPGNNYTVTVRDTNGCTAETMVDLRNPDTIGIELEVEDISCFNANDGQITVTATGGWGGFLYSKDNGATWTATPIFTNLSGGEYSILVKDKEGCQRMSDTVEVVNPEQLVIFDYEIDNHVSCFGEADGQVTLFATGGTGQLEYGYVQSITQYDIDPSVAVPAGTWSFVVRDENGCTDTVHNVTINQPNEIIVDVNVLNNNQCYLGEDGSLEVIASGGTGGLEYAISSDPGNYTQQTVYTELAAGTYTISVRDGTGCIVTSDPVTIGEPVPFLVNFDILQNIRCFGDVDGHVRVSTVGGVGAKEYNIALQGELHQEEDYQTSNEFTPLEPGIYIVAARDDIGCVAFSDPIDLSEPAKLEASLDLTHITCFGDKDGIVTTVVTGGTPPYTYSFNNGPIGSDPVFDSLNVGAYSVVVVDANGCQAKSETGIITQPNPLEVSLEIEQDITCFGEEDGQLFANATGGNGTYTYNLTGPSGTVTQVENPLFIGLEPGNYTVEVVDVKGCTALSFPVDFEAPAQLEVGEILMDSVSCNGDADGRLEITAFGGTPPYTYSLDDTIYQDTNVFEGLDGGVYQVFIKDSNDCVSLPFEQLVYEPGVLFIAGQVEQHISCSGEVDGHLRASISGGTPPFEFFLNQDSIWQSDPNFYNLPAGNYTITVRDAKGCVEVSEPELIRNAQALSLVAFVSKEITCKDANDAIISVEGTGGTPPLLYSINGAPGVSTTEFTNLGPGVYSITVTDANGCAQTAPEVTVTQAPAMSFGGSVTKDVTCYQGEDGEIQVSAAGGSQPVAYSLDGQNYKPNGTFTGLEAGTYTVYARDQRGCVKTIDLTVEEPEPFFIQGNVDAETTNRNGRITILVANTTPPMEVIWSTGDTLISPNGYVPPLENLKAGTYTVWITDDNGCEGTASFVVPNEIGIEENESNQFTLYPNPTNGMIQLMWMGETQQQVQLVIVNTLGDQVMNRRLSNVSANQSITIDLEHLPKGMYQVRLTGENQEWTEKLIIQ